MFSLEELYQQFEMSKGQIWGLAYNTFRSYYKTKVPKTRFGSVQYEANGQVRKRDLLVPNLHLNKLQAKILDIFPNIEFPAYMFGSIAGKNNLKNACQHIGNKYFLSIDLKDFFPNISYQKVYSSLVEIGYSPDVSRLLTKLITLNGGLPQGASTSNFLANLVFRPTAERLKKLADAHDLTFTCYLDDLVFSSNNDFKKLASQIISILRADAHLIAFDKISYRSGKCTITGILLHKNRIDVIPKMKKAAKKNPTLRGYCNWVRSRGKQFRNERVPSSPSSFIPNIFQ